MPINKETHTMTSTALSKELHKKIKKDAVKNKRSVSSQIAYILEEHYKKGDLLNDLEDDRSK